jgi:TatD DNase family protein
MSEIALTFFDSHCHFDFPEFDDQHQQIWSKAQLLGISQLLIPGVSPNSWGKAKQLAETFRGVVWAAGLHPWWIKTFLTHHTLDDLTKALDQVIADQNCVAIGETGLDVAMDLDQLPLITTQIACLQLHIDAAKKYAKPLILHSRKTHTELITLIKNNQLTSRGVIHAFSGSYEQAKAFVDAGFYLGIGGVITYERANKTREAVKKIPLDQLLLETDAPDMPMQGQQGKINSPINLPQVAECLADLKNLPLDKIAEQTTHNAETLFGIKHAA